MKGVRYLSENEMVESPVPIGTAVELAILKNERRPMVAAVEDVRG
jgi:hypothetical protein